MIKIELEDRVVDIASTLDEITLTQFESYIEIFNKDIPSVDKLIELITVLSNMTIEEVENMDFNLFKDLTNQILEQFSIDVKDETSFELNGIKYGIRNNSKDFKISLREMNLIQDKIKTNPKNYVRGLTAILFREILSDGSISKDLSIEAIANREEQFKDIKSNIIIPYVIGLAKYFNLKLDVNA